jgi:hypothetical protein
MYLQVTVQVPSWLYLHTTAATMLLPNISICLSSALIEGCDVSEESLDAKEGIMMNSPVPVMDRRRIGAERLAGERSYS